ncbi:hypothetical protein BJ165DRAFT_1409846 [Panaeolus papilionaceus]|nr:hypothetical protein BJ165DRAFT_1409846 [Panaeolus papilionaceus]
MVVLKFGMHQPCACQIFVSLRNHLVDKDMLTEESISDALLRVVKKATENNVRPVALVGLSNNDSGCFSIEFIQPPNAKVKNLLEEAVKCWNDGLLSQGTYMEDDFDVVDDYRNQVLEKDDIDDLCQYYGLDPNDSTSSSIDQGWKPFEELMESSNNWLNMNGLDVNFNDIINDIEKITLSDPPASRLMSKETLAANKETGGNGMKRTDLDEEKKPSIAIVSSSSRDLKDTALLKTWNLTYNTVWNLLICLGCEEGILLDHLPSHLGRQEHIIHEPDITPDGKLYGSSNKTVDTLHSPFPYVTSAEIVNFKDKVVASLKQDPIIKLKDRSLILNHKTVEDWKEHVGSSDRIDKPVEGLKLIPMVSCNGLDGCHHNFLKLGTLRNHRTKDHRPKNSTAKGAPFPIEPCWVWGQTFSTNTNAHAPCFQVIGHSPGAPQQPLLPGPMTLNGDDIDNIIADMDSASKFDVRQDTNAVPLLGTYTVTGVEAFILSLDTGGRHLIKKRMAPIPYAQNQNAPLMFRRLRHALLCLFKDDMILADPTNKNRCMHTSILHRITNATLRPVNPEHCSNHYHKGQTITGAHKHISQYIPFELWRLMYLLIKVVRPVEQIILRIARDLEGDELKALASVYYNHLFASNGQAWKETTYTNALGMVLQQITGYRITLRQWRQMAIAIQIRFLPSLQFIPQRILRDLNTTGGGVGDTVHRLSGHTARVAQMHYAKQEEHGSSIDGERHQSWNASLEYQTLLGFPATRDEAHNRPPIPTDLIQAFTHPKASSLKKEKVKVQKGRIRKTTTLQPSTLRVTRSKTLKAPDIGGSLTLSTHAPAASSNSEPFLSNEDEDREDGGLDNETSEEEEDLFEDETESEHSDWDGY